MDYFLKLGGEKLNTLVGKTEITLDGEVASLRTKGTNLGNLITDAMAWKTNSEIAILNAGGIRASINVGDITYRDVLKVLPFGNTICVLQLYGKEIIEIIDYVVSIQPGKGAYPQISGLTFTYENGEVKDVMVNGEVLENERVYRIATNDYLALGGDGYEVFKTKGENVYDTGFVLDKVIVDYIQSLGTITEYSSESRYNRK
jgi:5'-nucleotidase/UDP-sugar diphosphatase